MARMTPEQLKLMQLKIKQRSKEKQDFNYSTDVPKDSIFIPGEVKSKKNSKRLIPYNEKGTGKCKCRQISSKAYMEYVDETLFHYQANQSDFAQMIKGMTPPYNIQFTFAMSTKRKFDYNNLAQGVQDLMVTNGWLEDDNYAYIKPFFGDVIVDKDNPGVYISIYNA